MIAPPKKINHYFITSFTFAMEKYFDLINKTKTKKININNLMEKK